MIKKSRIWTKVSSKMKANPSLSQKELKSARNSIRGGAGLRALKGQFSHKLSKDWQARRLLRTESTRIESSNAQTEANRKGSKVQVDASPTACKVCLSSLKKGLPPYHPNCKCSSRV